jgi:hypothetical protein
LPRWPAEALLARSDFRFPFRAQVVAAAVLTVAGRLATIDENHRRSAMAPGRIALTNGAANRRHLALPSILILDMIARCSGSSCALAIAALRRA